MANTKKKATKLDYEQAIQGVYNDENATLSVDGFLTGKVGRKVELTISTTTILDDTEIYNFSEDGIALYELTIIYTDGSRTQMISAERTT